VPPVSSPLDREIKVLGAFVAMGWNNYFLYEGIARWEFDNIYFLGIFIVSNLIAGVLGYVFTKKIKCHENKYGLLFLFGVAYGLLAGILIGCFTGTLVCPVIGTVVGVVMGMIYGAPSGIFMAFLIYIAKAGSHKYVNNDK